jgi:1,4-alpha-glucan branching enzyme
VTLRVTPLAGMLAAAAVAGIAVLGALAVGRVGSGSPAGETMAAAPAASGGLSVLPASYGGEQQVSFVFLAPAATNVSVVGDFNDWDTGATPLARVDERGIWTVTLPLRPGRYLYMFVVDGTRWAPDPAAPVAPDDGFGVPNSVVTVGGPVS